MVCFYLLVHLEKEGERSFFYGALAKGVHLSKHLLHPLLVGLDVLHLPLQAVLHLVLDKVNADPSLSVLDAFIINPEKQGGIDQAPKLLKDRISDNSVESFSSIFT